MNPIKTYVIDLFCGAGGTTTAIKKSNTNIDVVMCINHDANAIQSHKNEYPECIHMIEDIRTVSMEPIQKLVDELRSQSPGCKIAIWASLECTNHSNAKGGLPRDADSRSLADDLFRYMDAIDPDFLWIENVREFMAWGPLDENGKPLSREKGKDYLRWVNEVKSYGMHYEYQVLNSANYGGLTIRTRYFAQFAKEKEFIQFPKPTHTRNPEKNGSLFGGQLKKWRGVREALDFADEGISIFTRKKPLAENTLKRVLAGLIKFVANGDDSFINKYYSGNPSTMVSSIDQPSPTIKTRDGNALVKCVFLSTYYGHGSNFSSEVPAPTVTTKDRISQVTFIGEDYSNATPRSIDSPTGTITTVPKQNIVTAKPWLINMNSSTSPPNSIENPSPSVTSCRTHYLVNPQYNSKGNSIDSPCFTLIARMDKAPPYVVAAEKGCFGIVVYDSDSEATINIKKFMAAHRIIDVKMRMLKIEELLPIQGFPKDYKLAGTKTEKKKYIGNSVEVNVGIALFKSIDKRIQKKILQSVA